MSSPLRFNLGEVLQKAQKDFERKQNQANGVSDDPMHWIIDRLKYLHDRMTRFSTLPSNKIMGVLRNTVVVRDGINGLTPPRLRKRAQFRIPEYDWLLDKMGVSYDFVMNSMVIDLPMLIYRTAYEEHCREWCNQNKRRTTIYLSDWIQFAIHRAQGSCVMTHPDVSLILAGELSEISPHVRIGEFTMAAMLPTKIVHDEWFRSAPWSVAEGTPFVPIPADVSHVFMNPPKHAVSFGKASKAA